MGSPTTIRQQIAQQPSARTSVRRAPSAASHAARGQAWRSASTRAAGRCNFPALVTALNEGPVTPAPPREVPAGHSRGRRSRGRRHPATLAGVASMVVIEHRTSRARAGRSSLRCCCLGYRDRCVDRSAIALAAAAVAGFMRARHAGHACQRRRERSPTRPRHVKSLASHAAAARLHGGAGR